MRKDAFYEEDLAYIHHVGFGSFAENAGAQLINIFQHANIRSGLVLDLGCGTGIWSKILTDCGYQALGIDVSAAMIKMAKKYAPKATFKVGSIYNTPLPPAAAVTILGEGLNYLVGESSPLDHINPLFKQINAALPTGGILAFDVIVKDETEPMHYRSWQKGEDWAVLVLLEEDTKNARLTRSITSFRAEGGTYHRQEETHVVHVFNETMLSKALSENGFSTSISSSYGSYDLAPRRRAYIAIKSG